MAEEQQQDRLEPLLPRDEETAIEQQQLKPKTVHSTFWPCVFNLAKVITGAGMMSIPQAYTQIGSLAGTFLLSGVALLTYFTLAVLVQGTQSFRAETYPKLVLITCGRGTAKVLQAAVLAFLFGFNVVYLVVIKDILVGSSNNGLLAELLGLPASSIWVQPHVVLLLVALLCAPLLLMRSMDKLAVFNIVGVGATILLAATAAGLGLAAVVQKTAFPIPLLPQWQLLGPTKAAQLEALTEVLPVVIACFVSHQSLHPLMPLLKPYSPRRMCLVVATALTLVFFIFLALSVGASLAFGPALDGNVLINISSDGMAPLVGREAARLLSVVIRGGYMVSLVANLLLYVHPLRAYIAEIIWPEKAPPTAAGAPACDAAAAATDQDAAVAHSVLACTLQDVTVETAYESSAAEQDQQQEPGYVVAVDPTAAAVGGAAPVHLLRWQRNEQRYFYLLTYTELAVIAATAVCVPNIWAALSAIGDLASTVQAFIIPGVIAQVLTRHRAQLRALTKHQLPAAAITPEEESLLSAGGGANKPAEDEEGDVLPPAAAGRSGGKGNVLFFSSFRLRSGAEQSRKLRQVLKEAWGVSADWAEQAALRGLGGLVIVMGVALFANGVAQRL